MPDYAIRKTNNRRISYMERFIVLRNRLCELIENVEWKGKSRQSWILELELTRKLQRAICADKEIHGIIHAEVEIGTCYFLTRDILRKDVEDDLRRMSRCVRRISAYDETMEIDKRIYGAIESLL